MHLTRYAFASGFCKGKDVLELGCGAGMGLRYLTQYARRLVAGDYTRSMLQVAKGVGNSLVPLIQLDAQKLPFREKSFDVVLLFEAIYYLPRPCEFLQECHRILREAGTVLICSANKECPGFNASDLSHAYLSGAELRELMEENGFEAQIYGGFPVVAKTSADKAKAFIRAIAAQLNLIPKTMRGKELLKRVFYGGLVELQEGIEKHVAPYDPPVLLQSETSGASNYKVIYAVGRPGQVKEDGKLITPAGDQERVHAETHS